MIRITDSIAIDENDIELNFIRASGPGGQNVNKVSTAVELRFAIQNLPVMMQARVKTLAGRQLTLDGVLVMTTQTHRSQERNREEAIAKLVALLAKAALRPKHRIATRPTKASKTRRLEGKANRSRVKSMRQSKNIED
jgi:ribosome-associated protein